jgi:hypothetical protein
MKPEIEQSQFSQISVGLGYTTLSAFDGIFFSFSLRAFFLESEVKMRLQMTMTVQ